jgi:hypothetical protein
LAQQQPTVFHDTVTQVHVIASVKNSRGELVGALQKANFKIFDNGVEQEIASSSGRARRLCLSLC